MLEWRPTDTSDHPKATSVETFPFGKVAMARVAEVLADFRIPAVTAKSMMAGVATVCDDCEGTPADLVARSTRTGEHLAICVGA